MAYIDFLSSVHKSTQRDYLARVNDPEFPKPKAAELAKQWGFDYWDGDRRICYGGYRYMPGRWAPVAQAMIEFPVYTTSFCSLGTIARRVGPGVAKSNVAATVSKSTSGARQPRPLGVGRVRQEACAGEGSMTPRGVLESATSARDSSLRGHLLCGLVVHTVQQSPRVRGLGMRAHAQSRTADMGYRLSEYAECA